MKKLMAIPAAVLAVSIVSSCAHDETPEKNLACSYELSVTNPRDTFNLVYNGLKQGMWIEKHDGKKDTVYYRNDTLVDK